MSEANWHRVASLDEVTPGNMKQVQIGIRLVALYNVGGKLHATDDICTHADACLTDGFLEGDVIECPLHQGRFHIPTGKALGAPVTVDVAIYPVKTEGNDILVSIANS